MLKMLKEILKNREAWFLISFCIFSVCCFAEEVYGSRGVLFFLHYALLIAVYISIVLYVIDKITVARKARAGIFLKEVSYGND